MKFKKSDILKMGGTALVTVFVCIFLIPFIRRGGHLHFHSDMISWTEADKLKNEYLSASNPHPLKTLYKDASSADIFSTLQGFKFSADQLNEIINNNQQLKYWQKADEVMFYFGKDGVIKDPITREVHANMHIIAVGMLKNQLLIPGNINDQGDPTTSSISDHADPCPPGCADNKR